MCGYTSHFRVKIYLITNEKDRQSYLRATYLFSRSATDGLYAMYNWEGGTNVLTTREQTLERCPNLALASAFFTAGTKEPFSPGS